MTREELIEKIRHQSRNITSAIRRGNIKEASYAASHRANLTKYYAIKYGSKNNVITY